MISHVLKDRYKILREIGSGGMAKIYLAHDLQENGPVAVKVLHSQFKEDPAFLQRFKREAMLAKTLNDPHIVPVLDEGVDNGCHFLVMEYIEGPNLHHLIRKKGPFEWPMALKIVHQLAIALEHAHEHGVVHRDIKPQNMILAQGGLLKVLDFGIARITTLPSLTQTGAIMGSPQYFSPEQVRGREIGGASDIYSSGLILYELLTGTGLFEGETAWSIIGHYMSYKPLPIKLPTPEIPEAVRSLLTGMLARDPEDRPQATALRQKIEEILAGHSPVKLDHAHTVAPRKIRYNLSLQSWQKLWQPGAIVGLIVITICLALLIFGANTQAFGESSKAELKSLYEEAHREIERGNVAVAIIKLDRILQEDPDYADVSLLRNELITRLTPTPTAQPVVARPSGPTAEPLDQLLAQAQEKLDQGHWTEAIMALKVPDLLTNSGQQRARVTAILCEAYLGRGLDKLAEAIHRENAFPFILQARADFEAGAAICPRRTELRDQAEQAAAYLKALRASQDDYEALILNLRPLVASSPDYMGQRAKEMLYYAYLQRAGARQLASESMATILADYEAALALQVNNPAVAQTRRAMLLLSFARLSQMTAEPALPLTQAAQPLTNVNPMQYRQPSLARPANDTIFAGRFTEVYLEWEAAGELAAGEYYDVTIMHLFAGEPRYFGSTRTRETRIKIGPEIGVGQAANDRFYWWITIRKEGTAPTPGSLDLPLSPQSEARTFIWGL